MNHLAQINIEFLKTSRSWNDLSLDDQKYYLKRHPKSKRKITAKPKQLVNDDISQAKSLLKRHQFQRRLEKLKAMTEGRDIHSALDVSPRDVVKYIVGAKGLDLRMTEGARRIVKNVFDTANMKMKDIMKIETLLDNKDFLKQSNELINRLYNADKSLSDDFYDLENHKEYIDAKIAINDFANQSFNKDFRLHDYERINYSLINSLLHQNVKRALVSGPSRGSLNVDVLIEIKDGSKLSDEEAAKIFASVGIKVNVKEIKHYYKNNDDVIKGDNVFVVPSKNEYNFPKYKNQIMIR